MRFVSLFLLICAPALAADVSKVRIVTSDIDNFWRAYDMATPENRTEVFQREYLDKGSPGLKDFIRLRFKNAQNLTKKMAEMPKFYASMRPATLRMATQTDIIRRYLLRFQELYPEAVFPDVYFVIGVASTGGTASERGLLIGAEMHTRAPETDESEFNPWLKAVLKPVDEMPVIVIHELVHFQQKSPSSKALINKSLAEGAADFVSRLVTGRTINEHVREWAEPRRDELFQEFAQKAHGQDLTDWLYNGDRAKDRPADLGYWIGSQIADDYYERASDKRTALREIMEMKDPAQIWRGSKYAPLLTADQKR